ncbi:: hypothetical protein [Arcticibacter svalbardensis MN12-7]|uniref:Rieske domain-containing protein n=1 Tax=Arcticibacter svalbardensis MN12-7 TaxID=1150600 RepID=R9GUP5_9SPHI|nr:hypothetical protein [Arcticibacter svalbardensis]EOR95451.1 : hypothetical protein [Arcticibacter svalbardensis MN12-7]
MNRIALLVGICLIFVSCGKDPSGVPDVPVSFRATIFGNPQYSGLSVPGGYVEVPGQGVAGLIIYRTDFRGLVAYDRCSTVNPEKECAVHVTTVFTATDPCSGAIFSLLDGSPQNNIATKPLKTYYVTESSNGQQISVSN